MNEGISPADFVYYELQTYLGHEIIVRWDQGNLHYVGWIDGKQMFSPVTGRLRTSDEASRIRNIARREISQNIKG